MKPYAVYLLERFRAGSTVKTLAFREGIPVERIQIRLAAAEEFERSRKTCQDSLCDAKRAA
jgi:hypothetical protein